MVLLDTMLGWAVISVNTLSGSITNGFDRDRWPSRLNETHRSHCAKVLSEVTPAAIQKAESDLGVRYSILLALPYFDPVTFTVLDRTIYFWVQESMLLRYG